MGLYSVYTVFTLKFIQHKVNMNECLVLESGVSYSNLHLIILIQYMQVVHYYVFAMYNE